MTGGSDAPKLGVESFGRLFCGKPFHERKTNTDKKKTHNTLKHKEKKATSANDEGWEFVIENIFALCKPTIAARAHDLLRARVETGRRTRRQESDQQATNGMIR